MGIETGLAILISSVVAAGATVASAALAKKPKSPEQIAQIADKTTEQVAEETDAPVTGDEASTRRKKQASKDKFKIDTSGTGLNLGSSEGKTPGVQI